jgi:hypothetical protein
MDLKTTVFALQQFSQLYDIVTEKEMIIKSEETLMAAIEVLLEHVKKFEVECGANIDLDLWAFLISEEFEQFKRNVTRGAVVNEVSIDELTVKMDGYMTLLEFQGKKQKFDKLTRRSAQGRAVGDKEAPRLCFNKARDGKCEWANCSFEHDVPLDSPQWAATRALMNMKPVNGERK